MKKRIRVLSFLLGLILLLSLFASCQTGKVNPPVGCDPTTADPSTTDSTTTGAKTPDNDPSEPQVVKIYTADQLLTLANVINEQGTGEMTRGVIYRLMVDIDLNENWSAEVTMNGDVVVTVPQAPVNIWNGIKKFCGTLDGNGKKISGVYMSRSLNSGDVMGFIDELDGGTIKDLTIENSFMTSSVYEETEAVYVGGLVGFVSSPSTIENVTVKTNLYVIGNSATIAEGTVGKAAENALAQTGFAFEGVVYKADVSTVGVITPDTLWYEGHESDSEYILTTPAQVLGFVKLGSEGNTFQEKTIKLGADIDLNPGWDATVSVKGGVATYPTVPLNKWDMILQFSGILDGQGHILRGIYVSANLTNSGNDPEMICSMFGNISGNGDTLFGNVTITSGFTPGVRNLIILNSSTIATADEGANNRRVAGLVAYLTGGFIENIYTEMNTILKVQGSEWEQIAGIVFGIRHPSATVANSTISNVVYNGIVGVANGTTIPGGAAGTTRTAKIATAACNVSYENCLTVGAAYYLGSKYGNLFCDYYNGNSDASTITYTDCFTEPVSAEGEAPAGWSYNDYVGSKVPGIVAAMLTNVGLTESTSEPISEKPISEYDGTEPDGSSFTISSTEDLLHAAQLSQNGVTFENQELLLTANIDLNPGWDATVAINEGVATLPSVPTVTFPGFATFAGTFNGNDHTISGVYMVKELTQNSANLAFIEILGSNGCVKNVKFKNSFIFADMQNYESVSDCKIGGIAARINGNGGCLIDSVYADINVWYRASEMQRIGGIAGKVGGHNVTINNVIFAGTVGNMTPSNVVPSTSTGAVMSQFIGDGDHKTTLVISNYAMNGTCRAADGVNTSNVVAANDQATKTPGTPTVTAA
ncbi:MAG: hypothetical protein II955_00535 [Clostridia bacterium]|nr:hypothetical protein [Clostridia bacterium]